MSGYTNPRDIVDDYVLTYKRACQRLGKTGMPWTQDVAEKLAVSATIQADRQGYRGPEFVQEEGQDVPQEDAPEVPEHWQKPNNGFTYDSRQPVSEKQKDKIRDLFDKAVRVVEGINHKGTAAAEKVVNMAIVPPFLEQRGHEVNLVSFTRMNSGDASWVIDFIQRTWDVR